MANGTEASGDEYDSSDEEKDESHSEKRNGKASLDLEDMGDMIKKREESRMEEMTDGDGDKPVKEMLTPMIRESLTKQGYKLIGKL